MITQIILREHNVRLSEKKMLKHVVKREITALYLLDLCCKIHHSIVDDIFSALVTSGLGFGIVVVVITVITVVRSAPMSGSILGRSGEGHGLQIVRGSDYRFHGSDNRLRARTNSIKTKLVKT